MQFKIMGIACSIEPKRGGGAYLYYAELPFSFGFKIGVTNNINNRPDPRDGLVLISSKLCYNAYELEADIKEMYSHLLIDAKILKYGGNSEVFIKDIRCE